MDLDRLIVRFRQFGGWRLLRAYADMGVLWPGLKALLRCAVTHRSFKAVYPVITRRVDEILLEKYGAISGVSMCGEELETRGDSATALSGRVWFCWLQGMTDAPPLVRACLESQQRCFGKEAVVVLDAENYTQWATMPDYVVEKYRKGIMPAAMFSDMLRLELLLRYGGTWIDSTVLVTRKVRIPDCELMLYRYFRNNRVEGISNWFIHATPANPLLADVQAMLLAYWKDYDCTVEYYMMHLFLSHAARRYPAMIAAMPKANTYNALILRDMLHKSFDAHRWQELTERVPIHKLNYRLADKAAHNTDSYYTHIVSEELRVKSD